MVRGQGSRAAATAGPAGRRPYPGPVTSPENEPSPPAPRAKQPQTMKPATAAAKLGVYLPATPPEFQDGVVTREQLNELQRTPPEWLVELRRNGPHPRAVVAARLRVSTSGLARHGLTDPLTTEQIDEIIAHPPEWLSLERASLAEVKREEKRVRERDAQRRGGAAPSA
jgi:hypothetical protein